MKFLDRTEERERLAEVGRKVLVLEKRAAIFEAFVRGYTSKQWGVPPEKVPASVIARLKVRDSFSTDYFDDPRQGIPADGYNAMFERMLDHPNIAAPAQRKS